MLQLIYCAEGEVFSDFEIREIFADPSKTVSKLLETEKFRVATGHFFALVQLWIAKGLLNHERIVLTIEGEDYSFLMNGQLARSIPDAYSYSGVGYMISKEWLRFMSK